MILELRSPWLTKNVESQFLTLPQLTLYQMNPILAIFNEWDLLGILDYMNGYFMMYLKSLNHASSFGIMPWLKSQPVDFGSKP